MRALLQRVSRASVTIDGEVKGEIGGGLLVFLGISKRDSESDAEYLVNKVINLRIFEDSERKMNRSLLECGGEMLVVSQFTLYGDTRKGRRPSFINAAPPSRAEELYEYFISKASGQIGKVASGRFRAMMDVELVNSGPVTVFIDTDQDSNSK